MSTIREQQTLTAVPRKFHGYIKDIWSLQLKLETRLGHQPYKILNHPRFRAAYDFLTFKKEASEDKQGIGNWWTNFQKVNRPARIELLKKLKESRNGPVEKKFGFLERVSLIFTNRLKTLWNQLYRKLRFQNTYN